MTTLQQRALGRSDRVLGWAARLRVGPVAAAVGAVALLVGWLGSWNPSYWGDEAATVMSAQRPLVELFAEVGKVDAVHALYYLFMHFWIGAFGPSELSTRFPSALAVGALVAGTVVLGARLAGLRYGLIAGVVCLVLPRTTYLATEARSYALGTAVAVWITVWFVGLIRRREQRLRPWLIYGVLIGLASCLFLYLILLLAMHGLVLATSAAGRRQLGRWLRAGLVAGVVAIPIVVMGYLERSQIAFLAVRKYADANNVLVEQWFGDPSGGGLWAVPIIGWAAIVLATAVVLWRTARAVPDAVLENRSSDRDVLRLGLAWLVLPTAVLLAVDAWITPTYNVRYLSFSAPAAALLIALGFIALGRLVVAQVRRVHQAPRRLLTGIVIAAVLAVFTAVAVPGYLAQRGPYAKDGGSDLRQTADWIGANAQQGDAVVFDETTKPSRRPELAYRLYPQQFAAVTSPEVLTPYYDRAAIWDRMAPLEGIRSELGSAPSVWAIELPAHGTVPLDVQDLTAHGYRVVGIHLVHRLEVYQLQKESL